MYVKTFEGDVKACAGEYIVKLNTGDIYPCESDVLEKLPKYAYQFDVFNKKEYQIQEKILFNRFVLEGINKYLKTNFDVADMILIDDCLSYGLTREKALNFVKSGYDFEVLTNEYGENITDIQNKNRKELVRFGGFNMYEIETRNETGLRKYYGIYRSEKDAFKVMSRCGEVVSVEDVTEKHYISCDSICAALKCCEFDELEANAISTFVSMMYEGAE